MEKRKVQKARRENNLILFSIASHFEIKLNVVNRFFGHVNIDKNKDDNTTNVSNKQFGYSSFNDNLALVSDLFTFTGAFFS